MLLMHPRHALYRATAESGGGGGSTVDAAGAGSGTPEPTAETTDPGSDDRLFSQADLDRILADRLDRQARKLRREFEATAEKKAEEELADAAEWQKLAEKRQKQIQSLETRVAELEQQAETAGKFEKALDGYVKQLSAGLPDAILALLDGQDAADKLTWLSANAAKFAQQEADPAGAKQPPAANGVPPTPPPDKDPPISPDDRRRQAYFPRL